jgi:hypothetical protein
MPEQEDGIVGAMEDLNRWDSTLGQLSEDVGEGKIELADYDDALATEDAEGETFEDRFIRLQGEIVDLYDPFLLTMNPVAINNSFDVYPGQKVLNESEVSGLVEIFHNFQKFDATGVELATTFGHYLDSGFIYGNRIEGISVEGIQHNDDPKAVIETSVKQMVLPEVDLPLVLTEELKESIRQTIMPEEIVFPEALEHELNMWLGANSKTMSKPLIKNSAKRKVFVHLADKRKELLNEKLTELKVLSNEFSEALTGEITPPFEMRLPTESVFLSFEGGLRTEFDDKLDRVNLRKLFSVLSPEKIKEGEDSELLKTASVIRGTKQFLVAILGGEKPKKVTIDQAESGRAVMGDAKWHDERVTPSSFKRSVQVELLHENNKRHTITRLLESRAGGHDFGYRRNEWLARISVLEKGDESTIISDRIGVLHDPSNNPVGKQHPLVSRGRGGNVDSREVVSQFVDTFFITSVDFYATLEEKFDGDEDFADYIVLAFLQEINPERDELALKTTLKEMKKTTPEKYKVLIDIHRKEISLIRRCLETVRDTSSKKFVEMRGTAEDLRPK